MIIHEISVGVKELEIMRLSYDLMSCANGYKYGAIARWESREGYIMSSKI